MPSIKLLMWLLALTFLVLATLSTAYLPHGWVLSAVLILGWCIGHQILKTIASGHKHVSPDPLEPVDDTERFGLRIGQWVSIQEEGAFFEQRTEVIEFTTEFVVVTVFGPAGELPSRWWFKPEELVPLEQ